MFEVTAVANRFMGWLLALTCLTWALLCGVSPRATREVTGSIGHIVKMIPS